MLVPVTVTEGPMLMTDAAAKASLAGGAGTGVVVGSRYSKRLWEPVPGLATTSAVAWVSSAAITWRAERPGCDERNTAAAPDTWGAAMEVPLMMRLPLETR